MTPRDAAQRVQIRGHADVGRHHVWVAAAIALHVTYVKTIEPRRQPSNPQRKCLHSDKRVLAPGAHMIRIPTRLKRTLVPVGEHGHLMAKREIISQNPGVE